MAALFRPEMMDLLLMYVANALARITWHFDRVISFVIAFSLLYGICTFTRKLFPGRLGQRPRVWWVPFLFAGTIMAFPSVLDPFVARVVSTALGHLPWMPGMWVVEMLGCVWLAGCCMGLIRAVRGTVRAAKMAGCLPAYPDSPVLTAATTAAGVRGTFHLKIGPPDTPIMTCGLLRPCIIVPEDFAARYSEADQYAILLHECVHIKNRDPIILILLAFVRVVLWFDPVTRHALAHVKTSMECLCDWTVVTVHRVDRAAYAVLIVHALSDRRQAGPGFSGSYRLACHRISHVFCDGELDVPGRITRRGAGLILAGLVGILAIAAVVYMGLDPIPPTDIDSLTEQGYVVVHHAERSGIFSRYVQYTITR